AVKPDDTTGWLRIRFILDAVWNIYLSSQDSSALKTMLSALRIEGKTLYLGDNALDQGYELMVSLEVIKKCMNDDRFANILADLGDRRHELESDMNIECRLRKHFRSNQGKQLFCEKERLSHL
ncbi:MAG: hypothetical protein ACLP9D_04240, partial [Candidatus Bathyarchaeia archaeon]